MKRTLGLKKKSGEIKVVDFSEDDDDKEEGGSDGDAAGEARKEGESLEKDSRLRRGSIRQKRTLHSSEESAEDSAQSSSDAKSESSSRWHSDSSEEKRSAIAKRGAGFCSGDDGSPRPRRRRRRFGQTSDSSDGDKTNEVDDITRQGDSPALSTRATLIEKMFEDPTSSSTPENNNLDDDNSREDDGQDVSGEADMGDGAIMTVVSLSNQSATLANQGDVRRGAGDQEGATEGDREDARPTLACHPDVSRRECFNDE